MLRNFTLGFFLYERSTTCFVLPSKLSFRLCVSDEDLNVGKSISAEWAYLNPGHSGH